MQMERYSWATQLIHSNSEGLFVVVVVLSLYFGRSESIFVHTRFEVLLKSWSRDSPANNPRREADPL